MADEQVLPPEEANLLITAGPKSAGVGTGWQAYELLDPDNKIVALDDVLYPNALYMLPLAKALDVEEIEPVYLRDKVTWKKLPGRE